MLLHEKVQKAKHMSIFQDLILFRIGGKLKMCAVIFHQTKMNILYTYTYTQVKGCHLFGLTRLPVVYVLAPKYVCVKMRWMPHWRCALLRRCAYLTSLSTILVTLNIICWFLNFKEELLHNIVQIYDANPSPCYMRKIMQYLDLIMYR